MANTHQKYLNIPKKIRYAVLFAGIILVVWLGSKEVPRQIEIGYLRTFFNQPRQSSLEYEEEHNRNIERIITNHPKDKILASHASISQLRGLMHTIFSQKNPKNISLPALQQAIAEIRNVLERSTQQYPRASTLYWDLANFYREESKIYEKLGFLQSSQLALEQAQISLNTAISFYPYKFKLYELSAQIAVQQKKYDQAKKRYRQAIFTANWENFIYERDREQIQQELQKLQQQKSH